MADEERTILIDVEVEQKDFDKEIGNVNDELKKNQKLIKDLSKDYSANSKEIAQLQARNRTLASSKKDLIKQSQTEANSLNALRLKLANLTKERNNANTSTKEGAARFRELQKEIKSTTDEVKGFEEEGGDFRRSVGEYINQTDLFGISLANVGANIVTAVGLIGGLTAVAGGLFKAYTSSARGAEDLARANDRLDSVINSLGNSIADVFGDGTGTGFLDKALAVIQLNLLGLNSFIESQIQVIAASALRELEVVEIAQERTKKKQLDAAEELRQIRDEERNSIEVRKKANEDLAQVINTREAESIEFQEKRLKQLNILLDKNEGDLQLRKAVAQVEFEIADIQEEAQGFRSEALANDLALNKELVEDRIALTELQIQNEIQKTVEGSEERLALEIKLIKKTQELELIAAGENVARRRIAIQKALNDEFLLRKAFQDNIDALSEKNSKEEQKRLDKRRDKEKKSAEDLEIFRLEEDDKLIESENRKRQILLENEELTQDEILLIIEKSISKIDKLKKKATDDEGKREKALKELKIRTEQETVTALISIFGQSTLAGKAFALTQIGFDTAKAIASLTAASEANPLNAPTFGGAGIAQFIAGIARIAANIATAKSILSGSASAATAAGSGASASSAAGGGAALSTAPIDTGFSNVNAALLSQFGEGARADSQNNQNIIQGVSNIPAPQVSVVDINKVSDRVAVKESEASLG